MVYNEPISFSYMKKDIYVLLNNIRSLHNVGSIFRTADAAGVKKIFLCGQTGFPPREEITKTAIGAEEVVPWQYYIDVIDAIRDIKKEGIQLVAVEQTQSSMDYRDFKSGLPVCLVLGHEIDGVSEEVLKECDAAIEIPMSGIKDSLNVSVAFGIVVYELLK